MIISKRFVMFISVLVIAGIGVAFFQGGGFFNKENPDLYYAVFLTNGQVYFGNMKNISENEFVLTDVHYLQLEGGEGTAQDQLAESRFTLIKMGNEIHGPTDELYINRDSILFYETLRNDSKVVESIKESKK